MFSRFGFCILLACSAVACSGESELVAESPQTPPSTAVTGAFDPAQGRAPANEIDDYMVLHSVKDSFTWIRDAIKEGITERGMVVNNVSHIGDMLSRTGSDIGESSEVYLQAEALEFCSATVSRQMMEADPKNIIFCPYIIAVYVLPSDPETVFVAYRKPTLVGDEASRKALQAVEDLLEGIASNATK